MVNPNIEDLVYVQPPMPGASGGSGVVRAISTGEEGTKYLVEFDEGLKDWYHEDLMRVLLKEEKPVSKFIPKQTGWAQNPALSEAILDAWYKLSQETFNQAYELFAGFGAQMLEWLKETNPELFKNCYLQGHRLIGVTVHYETPKEDE